MREEQSAHQRALVILWLLILLFIANFGILSILQNNAFETGDADLGNMHQAAWYTLHLGYPADTYSGSVVPRFGGHVEPIFYLLALLYALHQTANTLLVLQTVVVGLGAIAAYMLARDVLASESAGLVFALAYLFFPSLQAAVLTEFHPVALAAPFLLFAFYYLQKRSYAPFIVFSLLAMSTKEDMSLLAAMLGLWAVVVASPQTLRVSKTLRVLPGVPETLPPQTLRVSPPKTLRVSKTLRVWGEQMLPGLTMFMCGVAWFIITVYVIIPHFSTSGGVVLFGRYAEVGGSPQGLLRTIVADPLAVLARLLEPQKLTYLFGLLLSGGLLTLAAPWALLLSAPSLGINMLSNYAPMYSGLSHYSAPVAPFIIAGAVYGARSVAAVLQRRLHLAPARSLLLVLGWLLACATLYQILVGFTPLSLFYRVPRVTDHERLLARFAQQIPAGAVLSAQTPLHPHLSNRRLIYPFPVVKDASYVLLDVTARPTMHPNDLQAAVRELTAREGFGIVDAADGYILLGRGLGQSALPDSFYSAFRTAAARPQHALRIGFGPSLQLAGYDIEDVDQGREPWTRVRLYLNVTGPLPDDLRIYPYYLDESGNVIEDTTQRPMVAPLWYPPPQWKVGETIVVQTLPWPVGDRFRLAVGVLHGADWGNPSARLPASFESAGSPVYPLDGATAVQLGSFRRVANRLIPLQVPAPHPAVRREATLGSELKLIGYDLDAPAGGLAPGQTVGVVLYWQVLARPAAEYHTFAHIYDGAGAIVAQSDGVTGGGLPLSWWIPGRVVTESRVMTIPATAPSDLQHAITLGVYNFASGRRLPVVDPGGRPQGDTVVIGISDSPFPK